MGTELRRSRPTFVQADSVAAEFLKKGSID